MENKIKDEFKGFISTLSTEICKQVLVEELKKIHNSFEKTGKEYKTLYNNYTKNVNVIKGELTQLQSTNKMLGEFKTNISKVDKALDVINGEHTIVIDRIIKDNYKLLNEFSNKVKSLNEIERNKFITELTSSMTLNNKMYISELKKVFDGSKVDDLKKDVTLVLNSIKLIDDALKYNYNKVGTSEKTIINSIKETVLENEGNLISEIEVINSNVDKISSEFNNKIIEVSAKIDKANKTIITLAWVILVLCIILMFRI